MIENHDYEFCTLMREDGKLFKFCHFPISEESYFTDNPEECAKYCCIDLVKNLIDTGKELVEKNDFRYRNELFMYMSIAKCKPVRIKAQLKWRIENE